ncbi:MAG TPA: hypothetical protein VK203_27460 [Nostocaceae cyanobacterium]|nr:hypothetical protein [Nostocaceae cyanobacterium]
MSYVSLLKNIPEFFSQPTGIAAIASLSIHGAIALIVPLLPSTASKTPEAESPKTVGLIELSPADQSRLPEVPGTSQVALQPPQLPLQQNLPSNNYGNTLTILPPGLNTAQLPPSIPQTSPSKSGYAVNAYPRRQVIDRNTYRARLNLPSSNSNYSSNFGSPSTFTASSKLNDETKSNNFNRSLEQPVNRNTEIDETPVKEPSIGPIDTGLNIASGQIPPQDRGDSADRLNQNLGVSGDNNSQRISSFPSSSTNVKPENFTEKPGENSQIPTGEQQAKVDEFEQSRNQTKKQYSTNSQEIQEKGVIRQTIRDKSGLEGNVIGRVNVETNGKINYIFSGSPSPELKSKVEEYFKANPPQGDKEKITTYPFSLSFKRQSNENTGNTSESKPDSTSDQKDSSNTSNSSESKTESTSNKQDNQTANPAVSSNSGLTPKADSNQPVVIPNSQVQLIQKLLKSKQEGQNSQQKE